MKLMLIILTMGIFGLLIQSVPMRGYRAWTRYRRLVPATSYVLRSFPSTFDGLGATPLSTATITKQTEESNVNGEFSYGFETDNGISVEVKGSQKSIGPNEGGQVMEGRYSYVSPEGIHVSVQWTADETGFHAKQVS